MSEPHRRISCESMRPLMESPWFFVDHGQVAVKATVSEGLGVRLKKMFLLDQEDWRNAKVGRNKEAPAVGKQHYMSWQGEASHSKIWSGKIILKGTSVVKSDNDVRNSSYSWERLRKITAKGSFMQMGTRKDHSHKYKRYASQHRRRKEGRKWATTK